MRISVRRGFAAVPVVVECTWGQFVEWSIANATQEFAAKEDLPHLMLCATRGSFRGADIDSEGFWALAFDFDAVDQGAFERALAFCKRISDRGLAHTTWSWGDTDLGTVCARIILPLDMPLAPHLELKRRVALGHAISEASGCASDPETEKTHVRFWYGPGTNVHAPAWAKPCWIEAW